MSASNKDKKYRDIILDESVLDIDSWLPKEEMDKLVQFISNQEKMNENEV